MGIVKLIILGFLIWVGYKAFKMIKQRRYLLDKQAKSTSDAQKHLSGDLVKCQTCGVHLPIETAAKKNGHFYCPPENTDCKA